MNGEVVRTLQKLSASVILSLIILELVNPVFTLSDRSQEGYVQRDKICCKAVTCPAGKYIVPCNVHLGEDKCEKCPEGMILLDNTTSNSDIIFTCHYPASCPEGTVRRVDSFKYPQCPLPCKCDLRRGYCGANPCTCRSDVRCYFREILTQNCGCDPDYMHHRQLLQKSSSRAIPVISVATETTSQREIPNTTSITNVSLIRAILSTTTVQTKSIMDSDTNNKTSSSQIGVIIGCAASVLTFLAFSTLIIFLIRRYWKKRGEKPTTSVTVNNIIGQNSNVVIGDNSQMHLNGIQEVDEDSDTITDCHEDENQPLQPEEGRQPDEETSFVGFY